MCCRNAGVLAVLLAAMPLSARGATAEDIYRATGVAGGVVVHLGCGDGQLTAGLHRGDGYLVQGLAAAEADVAKARAAIRARGLYGPVSAELLTGPALPYADNMVNLLLADRLGEVTMEEVLRVLAPGGVAYVGGAKTVKPRPADTDEWTHFLHDADGNPVAHDLQVGPPRYVQWVQDPRHARSHEHTPSIAAMVSAAGRVFYVADEGAISSLRQPADWQLVGRDAYNGVLLWKRSIPTWWPHICGWTQGPRQLQRRLVAGGDRIYVTLGYYAPVSAMEATTGKTLREYEATEGTEEILLHKGILLLAARKVTEERTAELAEWKRLSGEEKSPLHSRETMDPLIKKLRGIETRTEAAVIAVDAATGKELWRRSGAETVGLRPLTLSAAGDRAFYQARGGVCCLDLKTGKDLWSAKAGQLRLVCDAGVVCVNDESVALLSAQTGQEVWADKPLLCSIRDAFVINGSLWIGGFKPAPEKRSPAWGPYFVTHRDLATGKVLGTIDPENPGHHHRCYQNKATDRYILGGRRGTEFIDLQSGQVLWNSWVRGVCMYGVMPCNGLFYAPPQACGCYITAKLDGFFALSHSVSSPGQDDAEGTAGASPLRTAPADRDATAAGSAKVAPARDEWPTYRHDVERSGVASSAVPAAVGPLWQAKVGGRLSAPVIAGGKVLVASVDAHSVHALDAATGRSEWDFTAGARVDSPPTVSGGRAIFGCRDGRVYSLRISDGQPVWSLRAARRERRIAACGQVESASPAMGSVLVIHRPDGSGGVAYVTAGRSSYLDGGIDLCRVETATGKVLSRTTIYSPDPETGKQPPHLAPGIMPGTLPDILTSDGNSVYLRNLVFDPAGQSRPAGQPHLLTLTGFLDDTWPHRSYWIFGTHCSLATGCTRRDKDVISGRLLVFDASSIYGYGREKIQWSDQFQDGPYRLFRVEREGGAQRWARSVPIQVRAMLLAGEVLFVAGPPVGASSPAKADDAAGGGMLLALSVADGTELARRPLEAPPVFDGMAAAYGRLYLATTDGNVLCLHAEKQR